jgi:hypothetical protein
MQRTGLKKWSPPKRSERLVAEAMAEMERLLVFDANMQVAERRGSGDIIK